MSLQFIAIRKRRIIVRISFIETSETLEDKVVLIVGGEHDSFDYKQIKHLKDFICFSILTLFRFLSMSYSYNNEQENNGEIKRDTTVSGVTREVDSIAN